MNIDLLLEGRLEEPVARRILAYAGHSPGVVHGNNGFGYIKKKPGRSANGRNAERPYWF